MIYKRGNILDCSEDIIVHQTNCLGIMGGGLALQIRNKYPEVYNKYHLHCSIIKDKSSLLGTTLFLSTNDGKIIANCFGQLGINKNICQTNYNALQSSLQAVKDYSIQANKSIAIPYKIGCGLAGGDWSIVEQILDDIFQDCKCYLYQL